MDPLAHLPLHPIIAQQMALPNLCSKCSSILIPCDSAKLGDWVIGHKTLEQLVISARQGCSFCGLVLVGFEFTRLPDDCAKREAEGDSSQQSLEEALGKDPTWAKATLLLTLGEFKDEKPTELICLLLHENGEIFSQLRSTIRNIAVVTGGPPPGHEQPVGSLSLLAVPESPESANFPVGALKLEPQSLKGFERAKRWLTDCLENHRCPKNKDVPLPTRVIDVGGVDPNWLKLHITSECTVRKGSYTALSYCWGTTNNFTTTTSTLHARKTGFKLSDLPRTIQDAVRITRELGCRFLWVDALCIIQGSDTDAKRDWEAEASRMESIYGNAFIAISASSSRDANGGIFYPRHATLACAYQDSAGAKRIGTLRVEAQGSSRKQIEEPLNARAWVLQEWLLSPRNIMYTLDGMAWQCDKTFALEQPSHLIKWDPIYRSRLATAHRDARWDRIVENYSNRDLTVSTDKLIAFAGVARKYRATRKDRYIAGLWESTLLENLLWAISTFSKTDANHTTLRNPPTYRAPSWSWAAKDGAINAEVFQQKFEPEHVASTVIDCTVELATSDPFGPVSGGTLVIEGPMLQALRVTMSSNGTPRVEVRRPDTSEVFDAAFIWLDDGKDTSPSAFDPLSAVFLLLIRMKPCTLGLALMQASVGQQVAFRRIGVFSLLREIERDEACLKMFTRQTITII